MLRWGRFLVLLALCLDADFGGVASAYAVNEPIIAAPTGAAEVQGSDFARSPILLEAWAQLLRIQNTFAGRIAGLIIGGILMLIMWGGLIFILRKEHTALRFRNAYVLLVGVIPSAAFGVLTWYLWPTACPTDRQPKECDSNALGWFQALYVASAFACSLIATIGLALALVTPVAGSRSHAVHPNSKRKAGSSKYEHGTESEQEMDTLLDRVHEETDSEPETDSRFGFITPVTPHHQHMGDTVTASDNGIAFAGVMILVSLAFVYIVAFFTNSVFYNTKNPIDDTTVSSAMDELPSAFISMLVLAPGITMLVLFEAWDATLSWWNRLVRVVLTLAVSVLMFGVVITPTTNNFTEKSEGEWHNFHANLATAAVVFLLVYLFWLSATTKFGLDSIFAIVWLVLCLIGVVILKLLHVAYGRSRILAALEGVVVAAAVPMFIVRSKRPFVPQSVRAWLRSKKKKRE